MSVTASDSNVSRFAERNAKAYYAGAAADVAVGTGLVVFAGSIAALVMPGQATILGLPLSSILRFLGVFLLVFAIDTVLIARSQGVLGRFRSWIVAANWVTVALAVAVLALWHALLSPLGIAMVASVALAVGVFASLQQKAV